MLAELGQLALILALLVAALQGVLPLMGAQRGDVAWMSLARPAAYLQLALVALAFAILTHAFVTQDFSLQYVAEIYAVATGSDLPFGLAPEDGI